MDAQEARTALDDVERRQQQTVAAGTAPWSWKGLLACAAAFVAYGLLIDQDMIWLVGLLIVGIVAVGGRRLVQLRRRPADRWTAVLAGTFVLALLVDIAVQWIVRGAELLLPNTWGAAAAALTVILIGRPLQARAVASRRR